MTAPSPYYPANRARNSWRGERYKCSCLPPLYICTLVYIGHFHVCMRAVQAHTLLKEGDLEPSPIEGYAVSAVRDACALDGWQSVRADSPTTAQLVIGQGMSHVLWLFIRTTT